jgi:hypothetical protein
VIGTLNHGLNIVRLVTAAMLPNCQCATLDFRQLHAREHDPIPAIPQRWLGELGVHVTLPSCSAPMNLEERTYPPSAHPAGLADATPNAPVSARPAHLEISLISCTHQIPPTSAGKNGLFPLNWQAATRRKIDGEFAVTISAGLHCRAGLSGQLVTGYSSARIEAEAVVVCVELATHLFKQA